ncbi:hypothetical protein MNBD_UNCLBAC01-977 [hydrothermal vent metagenome]|uniref:General secretion pathway GspH domain-containing protein n=1 Tax=hydrothermal vent metagenome TaxID=652676 RepID=A0A3B1CZJ7_9ZZZZ
MRNEGFKKKKAFTLIEIILVVIFMGIVAGLSFPNLSQVYFKFKLNQQTDQLAYLMRYAQSRAVIKQKQHRIIFSLDQKIYWLEMESVDGDQVSKEDSFVRVEGRLGKNFRIGQDVDFKGESAQILFYPDGKIDRQAFQMCWKKHCLVVSTKEVSGYVHVF